MARVNVPPDNEGGSSRDSSNRSKRQKQYQEALSYEAAFQKKKQELIRSASVKQRQEELKNLDKLYSEEMIKAKRNAKTNEDLERDLAKIKAKMLSDYEKKSAALQEELRKKEYEAHTFATSCALKSINTQNVHERARTAAILADQQKIQNKKLQAAKKIQLEELRASKELATTDAERERISEEIRRIKQETGNAAKLEAKYREDANKYSEAAKRVDFQRLGASEKLAKKEQELADLRNSMQSEVSSVDSEIAAKKMDLEASSGKPRKSASISKEISKLEGKRQEIVNKYEPKISEISNSIEGPGGYREQANSKGTLVSSSNVESEETSVSAEFVKYLVDILSCLTNFNSAFHTYASSIGSRSSGVDTASEISTSKASAVTADSDLVSGLRDLVDKATTDDAVLRSELYSKIDSLVTMGAEQAASNAISRADEESNKDEAASKMSRVRDLRDMVSDANIEKTKEDHVASKKADIELRKAEAAVRKAQHEAERGDKALMKDAALSKAVAVMQNSLAALEDMCKTIDNNINSYFQYQAEMNARLQGTDLDYEDILKTLTNNLGMSMLVRQQDYIENIKKIVDAGIMHNTETRAFLATVSDKIANTFDVFDANLLKLVKLQQNDSTAARLGLESQLNKLLNSYFSDSSYLSDGTHDNVTSAILQASSMLSNEMSLEFEYMVHKWLGALYSMGVDSSTLTSIAKGLNSLGTGNVTDLSGNESLQALLAMSANKGGESYADILTNGLNAESTNNLLKGMIEYLMEIASNTDNNQVVKSAYSDLFGLNISDLRAVINLTKDDIESLSMLSTSYSKSVQETQDELSEVIKRTHMSVALQNLFDNALLGASLDIGKNPVSYGMWKTLNVIEGLTGGIALPFINVFGSGFDLNTTVTQLAKSGMAGLAMMSNLIGALGSGGLSTGMDINEWNNVEMTARGSANKFLATGTESGFSSSTRLDYAGSGSTDDVKTTEMSDAADSADEDKEIVNKNQQDTEDVPLKTMENTLGIWQSVADGEDTIYKQAVVTNELLQTISDRLVDVPDINSLLAPNRVFLSSYLDSSSGMSYDFDRGFMSVDLSKMGGASVKSKVSDSLKNAKLSEFDGDIWEIIAEGNINNVSNMSLRNLVPTLMAADDVKEYAKIQQLNKIIFPEYVRATIDGYSASAKEYNEGLINKLLAKAGYDVNSTSNIDEESVHPIVRQLIAWLEDPTTVLRVEKSSIF